MSAEETESNLHHEEHKNRLEYSKSNFSHFMVTKNTKAIRKTKPKIDCSTQNLIFFHTLGHQEHKSKKKTKNRQ